MTSAGPSGGPVALQRLSWSFAPLSVQGGKNKWFCLLPPVCGHRERVRGDDLVTSKLVVSCGGTAEPHNQLIPSVGCTEGSGWAQEETWSFLGTILCSAHRQQESGAEGGTRLYMQLGKDGEDSALSRAEVSRGAPS